MATETRPAATGTYRTGTNPTGMRPQPKQSLVSRVLQWWAAMSSKQKWTAAGVALLLILIGGVFMQVSKATTYVNLYENALAPDDMQDVSQALAQAGIPYGKTQDSHIQVPPSRRVEALADLTKEGIPHHSFSQLPQGSSGETHEQFTEQRCLMLERDLTMVLRQFNEVADANVKLVIPSETANFFTDQKQEAKAAVMLKLKSGFDRLPFNEAKSIVNLVAYSVPELKPENVQLTDANGKLLSEMLKEREDQSLPDNMIEQKKNYQTQYESQIRQILDKAIGPDKYALAVNVDLNWNQSESQIKKVGNPELNVNGTVPVEQQIQTEKYNKGNHKSNGAKQLGLSTMEEESAGGHGSDYEKTNKLTKSDYNTQVVQTKVTPGQVVRITASVLADQSLSESAIRTLTSTIKNAIGMDTDRGDNVVFGTLPFHQDQIQQMSSELNEPFPFRKNAPSPISGEAGMRIALAIAMVGIAAGAYYYFRQQKARTEKAQLVLAAGPTAAVSDISDLLNEKTGKVTVVPEVGMKANQTEKLEQLAKEKPTKVAELLKTTWLAEK